MEQRLPWASWNARVAEAKLDKKGIGVLLFDLHDFLTEDSGSLMLYRCCRIRTSPEHVTRSPGYVRRAFVIGSLIYLVLTKSPRGSSPVPRARDTAVMETDADSHAHSPPGAPADLRVAATAALGWRVFRSTGD